MINLPTFYGVGTGTVYDCHNASAVTPRHMAKHGKINLRRATHGPAKLVDAKIQFTREGIINGQIFSSTY